MKRIFAIVVFSILATLSVYGQGNYKEFLCLTSMEDNNIIYYSGYESKFTKDGNDWQEFSEPITLNKEEKIYIKNHYSGGSFSMTGETHASGNIMSLILNEDDTFLDDLGENTFWELFEDCENLTSIDGLILPAVVSPSCYESMFANTGITSIPKGFLPATNFEDCGNCYARMFAGCKNLKTIPEDLLPATELSNYCYYYMFSGCTSLETLPMNLLHDAALDQDCYNGMFQGCTNLKNTPKITISRDRDNNVSRCFLDMFTDCKKLNKVYINVTQEGLDLFSRWYHDMFMDDYECIEEQDGHPIVINFPELLYNGTSWLDKCAATGILYHDPDSYNFHYYYYINDEENGTQEEYEGNLLLSEGWLTNAYSITDQDGLIKTESKSIEGENNYFESGNIIVTNIPKFEADDEYIALELYYEYTDDNGKTQNKKITDINDDGFYTFKMPYNDITIRAKYFKDIDVPKSKELSPTESTLIISEDEIELDGNEIDMITINREEVKPAFDEDGNIVIEIPDMTCPNTYEIGFKLLYGGTQKIIPVTRHWPVVIESQKPNVADGYCEDQEVVIDIEYNGDLQIDDIESLQIGDVSIHDFSWRPNGDNKGSISFKMPAGIKEGNNQYLIKFKKGTSITSDQTQISATSRVSSTEMMFLYDDVVFMNNRDGNSRKFQSFKWTIDGDSVGCKQYYQDPGHKNLRELGKEIMVEVVTMSGEKLKSCPLDDKAGNIHSETLSKRASHQASVYPNPAQDGGIITIELENYTEAEIAESCIMIFNSLGSEVRRINHCQTINQTSLPKGIYTGYVARGNEQVSFKILVK